MKRTKARKTPTFDDFKNAAIAKAHLKDIKGGNDNNPPPPPDPFIGSDDTMDG
ncbi:MAG: hypothetical protein J5I98_27405 [Phaeodactylibacter sp.]|nr:hypothetical protein [Phaeodactylibacter sp.]